MTDVPDHVPDRPGSQRSARGAPATLRWREVEETDPAFAAAVLARFTAQRHHVLATLTRDGAPRVSGTEVDLWRGDLVLGSMPRSRKAADLHRDPRCSVHAHTGDGTLEGGDAKVSALAEAVTDPAELAAYVADRHPPEPFELFRLRLTGVVLTELAGEALRVLTLRPGAAAVAATLVGTG